MKVALLVSIILASLVLESVAYQSNNRRLVHRQDNPSNPDAVDDQDYDCFEGVSTCGPLSGEGFGTLAICLQGSFVITGICNIGSQNACRFKNGQPTCMQGAGVLGLYMSPQSSALSGDLTVGAQNAIATPVDSPPQLHRRKPYLLRRNSVLESRAKKASSGGGSLAYADQGLTQCQYDIILKITSTFETGSPTLGFSACENNNDGQGISAGFIQFTTSSGSVLKVVQAYLGYTKLTKPPIANFVGALQKAAQVGNGGRVSGQGYMDGLWGFCDAWQKAANSDSWAFQQAQFKIQSDEYLAPNKGIVQKLGLKTALAVGQLMDTGIQLGYDAIVTIAKNAGTSPANGAKESDFLGAYLNARSRYLKRMGGAYAQTLYRISAYQHILYSGNLNFNGGKVESLNNDGRPITISC